VTRFGSDGVTVDLPRGWEGQVRRAGAGSSAEARTASVTDDDGGGSADGHGVVLHAATFALPAERGDYGSGAVEAMGGSDVLVCVLEHEPAAVDTPLFRRVGIPHLSASMFSPQTMQRTIAGMAGAQQFFQVAGRAFCLYVVIGSWRTRGPLVRAAAEVVSSLEISS
jgi:hypothetical protein